MNAASRGRPVDPKKQLEQKQRLIEAARQLLSEKSYRSVTIRELGERAGVNSAMIRYYFDNKEGLFIALLDQMAQAHFGHLGEIINSDEPIKGFIQSMLNMACENAGVAKMIHDEIFMKDSPLRDAFIERFPKRMAQMLPLLIQREFSISDPLKAKYYAFSLMSLIVTPFIGEPVRKLAWKISDREIASPQWAEHIYSFFMQGVQASTNSVESQ